MKIPMNTRKRQAITAAVVAAVIIAGGAAISTSTNSTHSSGSSAAFDAVAVTAPASAIRLPSGLCIPVFVGNSPVYTSPASCTATTAPPTTGASTSTTTTSISPSTTTTSPVTTTTTSLPSTTAAPSTAPASSVASVPGCGLPSAAFCETFDAPHNGGTQTGDLDNIVWGVSRLGTYQSGASNGMTMSHNACAGGAAAPIPSDARVCNGQYVESNNDGGSVTNIDAYPKQPFNFAGRTGKVVFDVSADSEGGHSAWPEFLITDEPVPGVRRCISECPGNTPSAKNEIGFTISGGDNRTGGVTTVDDFFVTVNGVYTDLGSTPDGTITKGSSAAMNHFEVQVSTTRIDVYGTDAGSTTLKHLSGMDLSLGFSQGLVWINDVHYNARKAIEPGELGTEFDHSFFWDNLGFDGPKTYRDLGFDVPLAHNPISTNNQNGDPQYEEDGYNLSPSPQSFTVTGVTKLSATTAKIVLNATTLSNQTISVSVNGHAFVSHDLVNAFHWESFSIVVPLTDVVDGTNTLTFKTQSSNIGLANATLILVAATTVP